MDRRPAGLARQTTLRPRINATEKTKSAGYGGTALETPCYAASPGAPDAVKAPDTGTRRWLPEKNHHRCRTVRNYSAP